MPDGVYLGLGSNIGDRESNIFSAITALEVREPCQILKTASIYESEPLYHRDQPEFLNTVVEISTELVPENLLEECQAIEQLLGRPPLREKNEQRIIDIDILAYSTVIVDLPHLQVPHPDLHNRLFVLIPWAEIAADLELSGFRRTVRELLRLCPDHSKVRLHKLEKSA